MRQLTPKRLTAWLLTLVMALSLLPAAALADEVGEDLAPPAPQDYGYVRLVFSEGEQLDLHHGEYITECSPTAAVFGNASEDFITDGEYAALYYEGKLYHKAALDGVSINADAVLPAEDFAPVPMGKLAAQATSLGEEPVALTVEGTTGGTAEGTTGGTTQGTTGGTTEGATGGITEGANEGTTKKTNEGTTEGTTEETNGGTTKKTTGEQQLQQETLPPPTLVRKAPQLAAGDKYGYASFQFRQSGVNAIHLYSGDYINDCKGDTVPTTWQATAEYPDIYDFIRDGPYKALHYQGFLYLKGELDLHGANINMDMMKLGLASISPKIYVKDNASLYNSDSLIYSYDTGVEIFLPTGKKLELNAVSPGRQKYPGAIRVAGEVTITGGGRLDITYTLINTESGTTPRTLFGIYGGNGVTLRGSENHGTGPTVNIKMDSGAFGPEANDVVGIRSGGDLIIKGDSKVKIEMLGHKLGQTTTEEDVNRAITAKRLELLNNALLEIVSFKNVIHDIVLTAESGDVLKVDTTGFLNIKNKGNIQRYDEGTWQHLQNDYPKSNIHLFKGSAQGAIAKIIRAEQGVKIESFSASINDWYEKLNDPEQGNWNWAISGTGEDPELGTNMYRGNRRIDHLVQVDSTTSIYTWGSMEYIYEPQGVATVQRSNGLIMDSHAPESNPHGSQLYYAKVLEPKFNDIHVVRKGDSLTLTTDGTKGKFLYWYDALHPEGSGSGTSWTSATQKFTNIQQDMVLVPVYDPMTTGPNLSAVGYSEEYDSDTSTYTRYAYKDLTFAKESDISDGSGGYRVMLVPAQLPRYGENTYASKDLKGSPVMGLRNSRLYADAKPSGAYGTTLAWENIPEGSYRIACDDKDTGRCYFSQPFTFDPPVAPPYIAPGSGISEDNNHVPETVTITVERNKRIEYRVWNSSTNQWSSLKTYTTPFEVKVSVSNDVRIEAYAGPRLDGIKSEAYYAVRPTGVPTVKYGDTVLSADNAQRYFSGAIELTVEAPEGYEVWYQADWEPSESNMGNRAENGKAIITDSGNSGKVYFKLAKAFTVNGTDYRKLSHNYAVVHLTKLIGLPAPNVTVRPKSGGEPLTPSGPNTYTIKEFVNVELTESGSWPLNATMAYDTSGGTSPQNAVPYTAPFEVRGEKTISVFTRVPKAGGGYDYERENYVFKVDPSVKKVLLVVRNATAYDSNGNVLPNTSTSGVNVPIGARIKVVPTVPSGKIFKNWSANGIYDTPSDKFKEELFFTMPDRSNNYNMLSLWAEFADQSEAYITADTKVLLAMGKTQYNGNDVILQGTVGDSVDLFINQSAGVDYHALRTISYQWWEGESVGTDDNALSVLETFDESKTYTVKVTITANEGVTFASTAGVQFGIYGSFIKMKDVTRSSDGKTLTFVATPLREMKLTLPTLHEGDNLSKVQESFNTQLSPMGYEVEQLTWESGTPAIAGSAGTNYRINTLKLKLKQNRPLRDNKVVIDGTYCFHKSDSDGSLVVLDGSKTITVIVKSKGVSVSGTAVSWNNTDNAEYRLYDGSTSDADIKAEWKSGTHTTALAYTPVKGGITPNADGKRHDQTFSFDTIPEGNYKLAIFKPGKYVPKIVPITVGTTDYTCGQLKLWLKGDVNGDGIVNGNDIQRLYSHITGASTLTDDDALIVANANEDTTINGNDIQRIFAHIVGSNIFSD